MRHVRTLLHALERESTVLTAGLDRRHEAMPARLLSARVGARLRGSGRSPLELLRRVILAVGDTVDPWLQQLSNAGFGGTDFVSCFFSAAHSGRMEFHDSSLANAALVIVAIMAIGLLRRRFRRPTAIAAMMSAMALALMLAQPAAATEIAAMSPSWSRPLR